MTKYLQSRPGSIEEVAANLSKFATESEYQAMFKKELEKAGKGIGAMTPAEKKAFFNKIDNKYKAKNEAVDNPYAVGMAAAMKQKGDQPPLKKSTITKAHDIAKSIKKDEKNEEMKKETHSFVTNKMNQAKKDAPGEKQVVDPEPKLKEPKAKMSFKEMRHYSKSKKENMDATISKDQDPKNNEPEKLKVKAMTGTQATAVDTTPEVEYKN
jgi:hypothetical protein